MIPEEWMVEAQVKKKLITGCEKTMGTAELCLYIQNFFYEEPIFPFVVQQERCTLTSAKGTFSEWVSWWVGD